MNNKRSIVILSKSDPYDKKSWSGTLFQMTQQLSTHYNTVWINPLNHNNLGFRILNKISPSLYKHILKVKVSSLLKQNNASVVFAPVASDLTSLINDKHPIIYLSDATHQLLHNYYGEFTYQDNTHYQKNENNEQYSISRSDKLIYSSEWAANSAIHDYHAIYTKVHIIDFGANLTFVPPMNQIIDQRSDCKICQLLFIGVGWERKGGDIAYQTFKILESKINCRLIIIGSKPPINDNNVEIIPFLNKNDEKQEKQLIEIMAQSHFLVLPTRADCTPIVFCEAAAMCLPVITTATGGVQSIIREGKNGYALSYNATPYDYANRIIDTWNNQERYNQMQIDSRNEFETRLNWKRWGMQMKEIIDSLK